MVGSRSMEQICCVVLAAGIGKRMGGDLPKAVAKTREKALIDHVLESLAPLKPKKTVIVVGHKREILENHVRSSKSAAGHSVEFSLQEKQLGTGDAVRAALSAVASHKGTVLITYADHPLFTAQTLQDLVAFHAFKKATVTVLTFNVPPPNGYGRIIRHADGHVLRITEAKDCNPEELLTREVNSGIFAVDSSFLKPAIDSLVPNNAQGEYYLTDIVEKAAKEGQTVAAFPLGNPEEAAGVNSPTDMHYVNDVLKRRHVAHLRESGVLFDSPDTCTIDASVTVEPGAHIGPNVQLRGKSSVGAGAIIEGTTLIIDSQISPGALIKLGSRVEGASIGELSTVGPFANVRPGTVLGKEVRIGNFVETKNTTMRDGAKASHLTYLGDCTVGEHANIGAGTITCNYDGYNKAETTIGKGAFIGSNTALVAPVTVGDGAIVAAGSVITRDVPKDALGVARARQENKDGWAKARREQLETAKKK
jgi:bifunctional UDP-N-acetylglucosamine pyrophosphorylase/glucosamine-1-phosphate N-acetyltransferase